MAIVKLTRIDGLKVGDEVVIVYMWNDAYGPTMMNTAGIRVEKVSRTHVTLLWQGTPIRFDRNTGTRKDGAFGTMPLKDARQQVREYQDGCRALVPGSQHGMCVGSGAL